MLRVFPIARHHAGTDAVGNDKEEDVGEELEASNPNIHQHVAIFDLCASFNNK